MAFLTAIAVLGPLALLFTLFCKWRNQYWSRRGVPQLDPVLFFGDFKPIVTGSVASQVHFRNIYEKAKAKGYKQVGIYNFVQPQWIPLDLNIIKHIMLKDFDYFQGHGTYIHEKEPMSQNLFTLEGEEWRKLRAKLSPTFTTGKMKMMFETLNEKTKILRKVVDKQAQFDKEIQIKETLARFGTDVIASVAFGIECSTMEDKDNEFREIGKKTFEPDLFRFLLEEFVPHNLLGNLGYRSVPKKASDYFPRIVKETIKYRETNNIQRKDFMQLMLQMKNQEDKTLHITEQEIISESFIFYLAGFETSSSATTFALLELSQNQDIQDKLRKEILDVLEKNDGVVTYDVIMEMPYLDKVLNESLRMYPPGTILPRICNKDYKVPGSNLVIEKGTRIFIPAWGIHMDSEYYPNPEQFNPENFNPENKAKRPDLTFLPFGEGPRLCIGMRFGLMQSKMALITLLRDFKFSPHEKTKWPLEMDRGSFVLTGKGDIWIKVEKL